MSSFMVNFWIDFEWDSSTMSPAPYFSCFSNELRQTRQDKCCNMDTGPAASTRQVVRSSAHSISRPMNGKGPSTKLVVLILLFVVA